MNIVEHRFAKLFATVFVTLLFTVPAFGQSGPPPIPPDPFLDNFYFNTTNWLSEFGSAPLAASSNLVSVPEWSRSALLLDTTNIAPAFLNYNIVEADDTINLAFDVGAVRCAFICDWATADTNQFGFGPGDSAGDPAYLLAAGDFSSNSPDGSWLIYFDAGGTNIYFGGFSNGASTVFVSAPISWASNSIHVIGLSYSSNTVLYLDGQIAAVGGPVTIVPATNVWTNGFMVGSDAFGYEQARGIFYYLEFCNSNFFDPDWSDLCSDSYFTNSWNRISNAFAVWQASQNGESYSSPVSPGQLNPMGGSGNCVTGTAVYMTNMSSITVLGQGNTFTFTISGGTPSFGYDVFVTTNLMSGPLTNSVWTWLGQGTNCGIYSITNQPTNPSFYVLGALLATNGSGLTVAYQNLISAAFSSDGYGTPTAWYLWQGLSPQISGIGGQDADGDGLLNYQEYLYGSNPLVSEGFAVWVSEPAVTSGIP